MAMETLVLPDREPVELSEAKNWLRVTDTSEDALVAQLIRGARELVETVTGRALITRTVQETAPCVLTSGALELGLAPVQAVSAVVQVDISGDETSIDPNDYWLDAARSRICWKSRPGQSRHGYFKVTYTAGFGDTPDLVPGALRTAILMCVGNWFEHRTADTTLPPKAQVLVAPFARLKL